MSHPAALPRWIYLPAAARRRVRGAAAGGDGGQGGLAAFLVADHQRVVDDGAGAEPEDRRARAPLLCVLLGRPDGAGAGPQRLARLVRWLRPLILLPLVLPPVVGGIALLYAFGRLGLIGQYLDAAGIQHRVHARPRWCWRRPSSRCRFWSSRSKVRPAPRAADYEVVAATLGARPTTVWWRVTLPLLAPGLVSGAVLAFARSLGEFGATLTFAGSREGVTRTLPLEIYLQRETDADAAVALSILLVAVAAVVVLGLGRAQADRQRMRGSRP